MRKFELSKNRYPGDPGVLCTISLLFVLLLSGCAGKLPVTLGLTDAQRHEAVLLLQQMRNRSCPDTMDADLTLNWQRYGQHRIFKATLQASRMGGFRLSGLDPLGRPFFILVMNRVRFTLVDNLEGKGYTGAVDSAFLRRYIPAGLDPAACFSLLTAQLPDDKNSLIRFAQSENHNSFWFVFHSGNGMTRQVEIDPEGGLVRRQLLTDAEKRIVLDVGYEDYPDGAGICSVPEDLTVEGQDFNGSLQVSFDKLYRETRLPDDIFTLQIPAHFTVTEVK